jgi:hypothetical protein
MQHPHVDRPVPFPKSNLLQERKPRPSPDAMEMPLVPGLAWWLLQVHCLERANSHRKILVLGQEYFQTHKLVKIFMLRAVRVLRVVVDLDEVEGMPQ